MKLKINDDKRYNGRRSIAVIHRKGREERKAEEQKSLRSLRLIDFYGIPQGNKAMVVFQTGFTGSTGCVLSFNPVIYPMHLRSRKRIQEFGISTNGSIKFIEPVDFLSFLQLEESARLILTLRDNTERPETVELGANVLAGTGAGRIVDCARGLKVSSYIGSKEDIESGLRLI